MIPSLLKTRRFLPLFLTQFLGAFNDNLFKNAMVMLIIYRIAVQTGQNAQMLVTLAAGIFMLPYFLFSATAGQLADKYDRAILSRMIKIAEIVIMVIASIGFILGNSWFLQFVLFCLGTQATFFGPIKYALLPQHLEENELLPGNAYIEGSTFVAILLGTIAGGLLVLQPGGIALISVAIIGCAILGYLTSRSIPTAPAADPSLKINWNLFSETWQIIRFSHENRHVFLSILGISWFWLVGAVFLAQFPSYSKDIIHGDETVATLLNTIFALGIGVGSILCNKILRGIIQATFVPLAALGITLFTVDLYFASAHIATSHEAFITASQFSAKAVNFRVMIDLFLIALCGGVFTIPLYAIMQQQSKPQHRARIIAANNVMNAIFMVASAVITMLMFKMHFTIPEVFASVGAANFLVALYICKLLPEGNIISVLKNIMHKIRH